MLLPLFKISLLVFVLLAYPNPTMSSTGSTKKDLVMAIGREGSRQRGPNGSAWLKKAAKEMYPRPRASTGCWNRPWICDQVESSSSSLSLSNGERQRERRMCCRNRCVEVSSDENNCGVCGVRCLFGWQCCTGLCMHTNTNPFHCGNCFQRCHSGSLCSYGLCGYALPLPPFTFPIPFPPDHPKIPNSHPPPMPS